MKQTTPKSIRLHIGIFGRRNAGKSSLLNAVTRQNTSIVSPVAGTTTDPVEKPMELLPLGPVLFIDTAGIDDTGNIGTLRTEKTHKIIERTDIAVIVACGNNWGNFEENLIESFTRLSTPLIVLFNKIDIEQPPAELLRNFYDRKIKTIKISALNNTGLEEFRLALLDIVPPEYIKSPEITDGIIQPGEYAILVVPIDKEAPKGRIILPQVQTIRSLLDKGCFSIVVREHELKSALDCLKSPPAIVITDSQAFEQVAEITPPTVKLTSFSILFARLKADIGEMAKGAIAIDSLKDRDRVLIAEACTHHPIEDDIGRVKIPNWIKKYTGADIIFDTVQGHDLPESLNNYKLIIHCGACMFNRKEMLSRIFHAKTAGVPITNYGIAIAFLHGIMERALEPFRLADGC